MRMLLINVFVFCYFFKYEISNMSVYPQHTDMPEEMRVETMELCVTACEKFATNNEVRLHYVAYVLIVLPVVNVFLSVSL